MGWMVNATPRPLYHREKRGTHCIGGWVGPRAGLDGCGKPHCPPGFDSRTAQSVASRCTDWAIRPTWSWRQYEFWKRRYPTSNDVVLTPQKTWIFILCDLFMSSRDVQSGTQESCYEYFPEWCTSVTDLAYRSGGDARHPSTVKLFVGPWSRNRQKRRGNNDTLTLHSIMVMCHHV